MPFGDRTGPEGMGPMTGRGAGYCSGNTRAGFGFRLPFRRWFGFGPADRGFGRGGGRRGPGRGFGFRGASPPWPYVGIGRGGYPRHTYFYGDPDYNAAPNTEDELTALKNMAQSMTDQLSEIQSRIDELTKDKPQEE